VAELRRAVALDITRRRFIEGAGVLTLSLLQLRCGDSSELVEEAGPKSPRPEPLPRPVVVDFRGWEDVYRQKWSWDRVVKGAHHVINCVSACPFDLFVKDGIVLREEQNAGMEANNASLPDFNPRGCQKGLCFSQLMYGPSRLKHPLKRVGERGGGQWKRISWDEALTEIADKIIEISVEDGPECVVYDSGTANWGYGSESGEMAAFDILGSTQLDGWAAVGDMPLGAIMTWGLFNVDGTGLPLARESLLHPDPRRPLPVGGPLQRDQDRQHRPGLQRLDHALRSVGEPSRGHRLRPGPGDGERDRVGGPVPG
jgi:hypothetical protein